MIPSRFLLSKNGPLGTIWVAAHCLQKLKKDQFRQTDIPSSVDKILQDAVPEFTYRIIAYLLLGVVRIYSKKVDFLFDDCCNARDRLYNIAGPGIKPDGTIVVVKNVPTNSISIPHTFELDAFELEVSKDNDIGCSHVMAPKETMLADTWNQGVGSTKWKNHWDEDLSLQIVSSICTPIRDAFSPHSMDIDSDATTSHVKSNLESNLDKFGRIRFSLEDHLEQIIFGEAENDSGFYNEVNESSGLQIRNTDAGEAARQLKFFDEYHECEKESETDRPHIDVHESDTNRPHVDVHESDTNRPQVDGHESDGDRVLNPEAGKPTQLLYLLDEENNTEKLIAATPPLEEALDPISSQAGKESTIHLPSDLKCRNDREQLKCQNDREQLKCPDPVICLKLPKIVRPLDRTEKMRLPKLSPLPKISAKSPIPITIDAAHDSKSQGGAISTDLMSVRTPSIKDHGSVKKRKCVFDETTVLSNGMLKLWIANPSDLMSKRRKVLLSTPHFWKAYKSSNLQESCFETLIPCDPVALKSKISQKNIITQPKETLEIHLTEIITKTPASEVVADAVTPVNEVVAESPVAVKENSQEETPIAPATPVTRPTSSRLNEVWGVSKPEMLEPTSSVESTESELALNKDPDLVTMDEEIISSAGDTQEKRKCLVRTRKAAKFLHAKLQSQKKRNGESFINLVQIVKGKMRKESAQLFYEILVLKTGNFIDVKQECGFSDILVTGTSKLKDAYDFT